MPTFDVLGDEGPLPTSGDFLKTNFEDRVLAEKIKAAEG